MSFALATPEAINKGREAAAIMQGPQGQQDQNNPPIWFGPWGDSWLTQVDIFGGPLSKQQLDDTGNYVSFGPAPIGAPSMIEAALLVALFNRMSKTPEGLKLVKDIAVKYLDVVGEVLKSIHQASASNWFTALLNHYATMPIYQRLGLVSPHDALQTRAWLDSQMKNMLQQVWFGDAMQALSGISTLVTSVSKGAATMGGVPAHFSIPPASGK